MDVKGTVGSLLDGYADVLTAKSLQVAVRLNHCQEMAAICGGKGGGKSKHGSGACADEGF